MSDEESIFRRKLAEIRISDFNGRDQIYLHPSHVVAERGPNEKMIFTHRVTEEELTYAQALDLWMKKLY